VIGWLSPRLRKQTARVERLTGAIVKYRQRFDFLVYTTTDARPTATVPSGDVAGGDSIGHGELTRGVDRRARTIVE